MSSLSLPVLFGLFTIFQLITYSMSWVQTVLRRSSFLQLFAVQSLFFTLFFVVLKNWGPVGVGASYSAQSIFFVVGSIVISWMIFYSIVDCSFEPSGVSFLKKRWWFIGIDKKVLFKRLIQAFSDAKATILLREEGTFLIAVSKGKEGERFLFELSLKKKWHLYTVVEFLLYSESRVIFIEKRELEKIQKDLFSTL